MCLEINGSILVRIKIWKFLSKRSIFIAIAKKQIRQIISDNNFRSVADVYDYLKEGFKDILQDFIETEMDATLGYEKNQKSELVSTNKRNGYSTKTLKVSMESFLLIYHATGMLSLNQSWYQKDIFGIEEKVIFLYAKGMSTRDIHDQLQDLYEI